MIFYKRFLGFFINELLIFQLYFANTLQYFYKNNKLSNVAAFEVLF